MKFNLRLLVFLFKITFPVSLAAFPLMAIYGYFNPSPEAIEMLKKYVDQQPVLVGYRYRSSTSSGRTTKFTSRSYALFPSTLSDFNTIRITQEDNTNPIVEVNRNGFVFYVGWIVICIIGTWWFWLRSSPPQNV